MRTAEVEVWKTKSCIMLLINIPTFKHVYLLQVNLTHALLLVDSLYYSVLYKPSVISKAGF